MSAIADAVVADHLRKSYGRVVAVEDVSFTVREGEIFALPGPNGAGRTTTLQILEGFRSRDAGHANVLGLDPGRRATGRQARERIGPVLQDIAVAPCLAEPHRPTGERTRTRLLPGARVRRLLFWRYRLVWRKPPAV